MDRRRSPGGRAFGMIGRVVVIDAGQDGRGYSEDRVLDAQSGRQRPRLQMAVDVAGTKRIEEGGLLLLVPHAAIDDEIDAVRQGFGEAGGGVGALLVAVVEWRGGAAAVGDELIEADRGIDQP